MNKKYLLAALKQQNNFDNFAIGNDNFNIVTFGTDIEHMRIVSKARWDISGFQKKKLTKSELEEWIKYNLKESEIK